MSPQYGELTPTIGCDPLVSLGHPANYGFRLLASLLQQRRSTEVNQTLHAVWPSPGPTSTLYIHFPGLLPGNIICHVQNSLCVQVLRSAILTALLHGTLAACVSRTLRLGTSNGIMALSQRAPPIFGWVAITLGIGPHSIFGYICGPQKFNFNTFQGSVTLFRGPGRNKGIGNSNTAHAWGNTRDRQTTVEILTF